MTDKAQIFNLALGKIGDVLISDPEEGTEKGEETCRNHYDEIRKTLLEEHDWKFASKRAALALNTTDPVYGYDYSYIKPNDCITIRELSDLTYDWIEEDGNILTDMEDAYVRYTYDCEDTTRFSPSFNQCFATLLASQVVATLKPKDLKKKQQLMEEFIYWKALALKSDMLRRKAKIPVIVNKYINAR